MVGVYVGVIVGAVSAYACAGLLLASLYFFGPGLLLSRAVDQRLQVLSHVPVAPERLEVESEWCQPGELPAYVAPEVSKDRPAYRIQLLPGSGACSALMGLLSAAMYAEEHGYAYFLDETITRLRGNHSHWHGRFFQHVGLPGPTNPSRDIQVYRNENVSKFVRAPFITMGSQTLPRVEMRRIWVRRLWRFQPWVQTIVCQSIRDLELRKPYIAILIRRGDKIYRENQAAATIQQWVDTLQGVSFDGLVRDVFVGTDDCRAVDELRVAMPGWRFKSFCHVHYGTGWDITDSTKVDLDAHFFKFFGELVAMSASTVYIGDGRSNVHYWVSYMRPVNSSNASFRDIRKYPFHDLRNLN